MESVDLVRQKGNYVFVCDSSGRGFKTPDGVASIIRSNFTYSSKQMMPQRGFGPPEFIYTDHDLFDVDQCNRMILPLGLTQRLTKVLTEKGVQVSYKDEGKTLREKTVFDPVFENAFNVVEEFRHKQELLLMMLAAKDYGQFDCAPAFGKSLSMALGCICLPKARILITAKRRSVLVDRLYPEISRLIPDVGIISSTKKRKGMRIMCVTSGSLSHVMNEHWDLVMVDEAHEAAADNFASALASLPGRYRIFGFSGSFEDMRFDGKNVRCEALFGPVILRVGYQEARENKMVVPIRVIWSSVTQGDKAENKTGVARQRAAIWRNAGRNAQIIKDARAYADQQVIVSCATIEHICALKSLCPEAVLVYAMGGLEKMPPGSDRTLREKYTDWGWIDESEPEMTRQRQSMLFKTMQEGAIGIYICTGVVNVGIDLKHATVVIRADAASSSIMSTQVPGRVARINGVKTEGIVHDYLDEFCPTYARAAKTRSKHYAKHGWKQDMPEPENKYGVQLKLF